MLVTKNYAGYYVLQGYGLNECYFGCRDYQIPWTDRDALSLPPSRSGSLIYDGHGSMLIPSKQSAFTQLSTWSLPVEEPPQFELEHNMYSQRANSTEKLANNSGHRRNHYSDVIPRSSTQHLQEDTSTSSDEESDEVRYTRKPARDRVAKGKKIQQRVDVTKMEQAQKKILLLQRKCDLLERENEKAKKGKQEKINRIADLKHRNAELVNVAKRLEEKAKALHMENSKRNSKPDIMADENLLQKKNFASILAQVQTDHEKEMKDREKDIKSLKSQIQDLKRALSEAKKVQQSLHGTDEAAMKQTQKESLRLQKLAAAGSKKVTIRSLSMPMTARQKILEESNRTLRRQLAEYEEAGRALSGKTVEELKTELEEIKAKYSEMERTNKDASIQKINLESQLQIAKVEASDTNLKMAELKSSFEQLQHDYDTVHEQLSVAIKERDAAINQIKAKAAEDSHPQSDRVMDSPKPEKVVECDVEILGESTKITTPGRNDESDDEIPEILDITDLCSEHGEAKEATEIPLAGEPENQLQDEEERKSEQEEVPEEIVNAVMDDSESKLKLCIAKYTYDPYQGPNEYPEAELPLVAGDYVYVYGSMDEDGFYEGELMDGIRGLVPSNFLEPVVGDTPDAKPEKNHRLAALHGDGLFSSSAEKFSDSDTSIKSNSATVHGALPYPKKLHVVKQLSHSLIIGWSPPILSDEDSVEEYRVFAGGEFKTAVAGTKLNTVVEDIDHDKITKLAVCAVTSSGVSDANLCVFTHGKGSKLLPTDIRMEKIGCSSARVAWSPSSSQHSHLITVIEEEGYAVSGQIITRMVHSVSPPAYRLSFGDLRPNVKYKVSVVVDGIQELGAEVVTSFTTPESGPPDPPLGVQIEECSNHNYLLITWLPVTLNTLGTSNGVVVRGYSIHVAGTKVSEVHSPTLDQCTLRAQVIAEALKERLHAISLKHLSNLSLDKTTLSIHNPPAVYIKTHAVNGQESDLSDPCLIPKNLQKKLINQSSNDVTPPQKPFRTANPRNAVLSSMESTDVDVSFSSDISMPGFQTSNRRQNNVSKDVVSSNKSKSLKPTVPSIEITHDTSSDDEQNSALNHHFVKAELHSSAVDNNKPFMASGNYSIVKSSEPEAFFSSLNSSAFGVNDTNSELLNESDPQKDFESSANSRYRNLSDKYISSDMSHQEPNSICPMTGTKTNFISSGPEKFMVNNKRASDRHHRHSHKFHDDARMVGKRPQSANSDEQSIGSHLSQSSSRHGHYSKVRGKDRNVVTRQSTMSSQSGSEMAPEAGSNLPSHIDSSKVSLFAAVYSYDPSVSSPNVDSYSEELCFSQGQLIKVYGDKDEDGFYYGETHTGEQGYVPCNMVSYIPVDNKQRILDLHERGYLPSASPDESEQSTNDSSAATKPQKQNGGIDHARNKEKYRYFIALFDYDPQDSSPNADADVELRFSCNDVIRVIGEMDDDGFYKGELNGRTGLVPSNFLDEISRERFESRRQNLDPTQKKTSSSKSLDQTGTTRSNHQAQKSDPVNRPMDKAGYFSNSQPTSIDHVASRKKGGFISKGKKLFKRLGTSQDGKKR